MMQFVSQKTPRHPPGEHPRPSKPAPSSVSTCRDKTGKNHDKHHHDIIADTEVHVFIFVIGQSSTASMTSELIAECEIGVVFL